MKEEFIKAIEAAAEKLKTNLIQDANTDWIESYSRLDLTPTQAKELADRCVLAYLAQCIYLQTSKNIV